MNPIRFVMTLLRGKALRENGPRLTFSRLCTSRHLGDLQILAFFIILLLAILFGGLILWTVDLLPRPVMDWLSGHDNPGISLLLGLLTAIVLTLVGALNWAYQAGSKRIGAVDLIACEITVLCRVMLVADFARGQVRIAQGGVSPAVSSSKDDPPKLPSRFSSEEQYTPVYDRLLPELVALDVEVVTYVTEFYTYRKAMVDYLRAIGNEADAARRHFLQVAMLYMLYLMFESARHAIRRLVEFEPNQTESVINILCSEVVIYAFLMNAFDDYHHDRLKLREGDYVIIMERLTVKMSENHPNWLRARTTWMELLQRVADPLKTTS